MPILTIRSVEFVSPKVTFEMLTSSSLRKSKLSSSSSLVLVICRVKESFSSSKFSTDKRVTTKTIRPSMLEK